MPRPSGTVSRCRSRPHAARAPAPARALELATLVDARAGGHVLQLRRLPGDHDRRRAPPRRGDGLLELLVRPRPRPRSGICGQQLQPRRRDPLLPDCCGDCGGRLRLAQRRSAARPDASPQPGAPIRGQRHHPTPTADGTPSPGPAATVAGGGAPRPSSDAGGRATLTFRARHVHAQGDEGRTRSARSRTRSASTTATTASAARPPRPGPRRHDHRRRRDHAAPTAHRPVRSPPTSGPRARPPRDPRGHALRPRARARARCRARRPRPVRAARRRPASDPRRSRPASCQAFDGKRRRFADAAALRRAPARRVVLASATATTLVLPAADALPAGPLRARRRARPTGPATPTAAARGAQPVVFRVR